MEELTRGVQRLGLAHQEEVGSRREQEHTCVQEARGQFLSWSRPPAPATQKELAAEKRVGGCKRRAAHGRRSDKELRPREDHEQQRERANMKSQELRKD